MAEDIARQEQHRWLLEPPATGDVHVHIEAAEGTELTPEALAAVAALTRALAAPEVAGYACSITGCTTVHTCAAVTESCVPKYSCKITRVAALG